MISERTLRRWRKEALDHSDDDLRITYRSTAQDLAAAFIECRIRVLKMTQELLDQYLMKKK